MAVKYIWEIVFDDSDFEGICVSRRNKYTVVYENETYFYCKSNETDKLIHFEKDTENESYWDDSYGKRLWSTNGVGIEEKIEEQKIHDLISSIDNLVFSRKSLIKQGKNIDKQIEDYSKEIQIARSQLLSYRIKKYLAK